MAFVLRKAAAPGDPIREERSALPVAPGAVTSPQEPGEVPDRTNIPEQDRLPIAPAEGEVRRPETEYGTAQRIMGVFERFSGAHDDPARFEQATVSYEEIRKATPALRTPNRPAPGYALAEGTRESSSEIAAVSAHASGTRDPGE